MQTIEINTNNYEQGLNFIKEVLFRTGSITVTYDESSEDELARKTLESFELIKQMNKGISIPKGVDIDQLANESNL